MVGGAVRTMRSWRAVMVLALDVMVLACDECTGGDDGDDDREHNHAREWWKS